MEKKQVLNAIKKAREGVSKKNFKQSFDLIVNLKGLNLKKPEENINDFLVLKNRGKKAKVGAFVGQEIVNKAKGVCDVVVPFEDFGKFETKAKVKKLAKGVDFFISQVELMPKVAASFGRVLGPVGKMPNPKAGCVIPKTIPDLKPVVAKLSNTIRLQTKNETIIKCMVGVEDMKDEEIADNVIQVYDYLIHHLPQEKNNIRSSYLKLTMGKSILIGEEAKEE